MIDLIAGGIFAWLIWELYSGLLLRDLYNTETNEYLRPPVSFLNAHLRKRRNHES